MILTSNVGRYNIMFMTLETSFYDVRDLTPAPDADPWFMSLQTWASRSTSLSELTFRAKFGTQRYQTGSLLAGLICDRDGVFLSASSDPHHLCDMCPGCSLAEIKRLERAAHHISLNAKEYNPNSSSGAVYTVIPKHRDEFTLIYSTK